ncbi:MAG TPA: hypothetical protein VGS05_10285 [Candidatus Sulfotelmatobacter sp.]|nr:hypothetical protein [Candidatus Sulfotelmatobacter sp.]
MTKINQNQQKGVALILGMILLLLITAIAFGVIGMANTENAINTNFKGEETEYFAARAGVEEGRNRILSNATDQNGVSDAFTAAQLPSDVPDNGGKILYILNGTKTDGTPVTLADVTTIGSAYSDDELCHEIPAGSPLAISPQVPNNVRCPKVPAATFISTPSVAPYPLDYKWVRVMIKENGSGPYQVDKTQAATLGTCWDETSIPAAEIATAVANCAPVPASKPLDRPVYLVTALAVNSNGTTRRLVQEEISLGITFNPNYAIYATSKQCPSVTFTGNGATASFTATAGNEADPPVGANRTSGADVGSNGGISLSGNATIGGAADILGGACFTPDKMNSPATATNIANPPTYRVTAQPNPPTPQGAPKKLPNPMTPGNVYGDISLSGKTTLTLQVPDGQGTAANPAVFMMNSLSMSGQSSLAITPVDGGACGGSSYCYVTVIIGGNGTASPLSLTGNSWGNTSGIPEMLQFDLAQPTACVAAPCGTVSVTGNGGSYAVVNAPMDNVQISGNGDIFGSVVSYSTTDTGNGTLWHDTNNASQYTPDPYLHLIAYRELNY